MRTCVLRYFQWDYYSKHISEIPQIWHGGLAIHGGLIGAIVTGVIFAKKRKLSFWKLADIAAPSIILGQAIGRWGNFMNQEAHGGPVSRAFLEVYICQIGSLIKCTYKGNIIIRHFI